MQEISTGPSESQLIRRELRAEASAGTLPAEHADNVASWSKRRNHASWIPRGVDGPEYLKVATRLAFRRNQQAARPDESYYAEEVGRLRARVHELLGSTTEETQET